jgi:protein-S-isoprenylcysteine O-methyltransferase Ste14
MNPPALGRRGEGWVVLQSIVFVAIFASAAAGPRWPHRDEPWPLIVGLILVAFCLVVFVVSRVTLGNSFTPLPRPRDNSTLRTTGIYARVRHPVYGGLIIGGIGLSLALSPVVLIPTAALAVVFFFKSMREEAWLSNRYPDYAAYRSATPRRFVPWLL